MPKIAAKRLPPPAPVGSAEMTCTTACQWNTRQETISTQLEHGGARCGSSDSGIIIGTPHLRHTTTTLHIMIPGSLDRRRGTTTVHRIPLWWWNEAILRPRNMRRMTRDGDSGCECNSKRATQGSHCKG